jgi:uncharacterized Zn finger protein (UPF0148 family)
MATRTCDRCGAKASPRWPRVRQTNGELWCTGCDTSQSHILSTATRMLERSAAGWSGEDVIRHELGRQKVHTVNGDAELCPEHIRQRRERSDFATGIAAQTGLEHGYTSPSISPSHEGRCSDCSRMGNEKALPWQAHRPAGSPVIREERQPTPHIDTDEAYRQGRWPYRQQHGFESWGPVDTTIRSLNMRVAIALPGPGFRGIRVHAHDSGDGETIFHCPFCGSGQVIARADGTVECEFCSTAFTVQVQPQMPAFPQTIDGQPVQVPGMPAGGQNANVPPGAAPGADPGLDGPPGAEDGDDGGSPFGDDSGGGDAPEDDDSDDSDSGGEPPWAKKSLLLRTSAGHALTPDQYMRHLALTHASNRDKVLARIRDENGAS